MAELLSPSNSLRTQQFAFGYGADAVYAGLPRYSLRVRNNGYGKDELAEGIAQAHAQGKLFYLTTNLYPRDRKLDTFVADLAPVVEAGPDALILADPGLVRVVRKQWPSVPVHLSVQANTTNSEAVKFWQEAGVSRVILSRELQLEEIAEIRHRCPDMELEVFVHGALCIAYSGRCLLSGYFNHRDANQGACTNSCRWDYQLQAADKNAMADGVYLAQEGERPGELMPMWEDEHGTYIFNSKDLCAIDLVKDLVEMGIDSLKIEGRTKSHYYVARTAQLYRQAIDSVLAHQGVTGLRNEALKLANRGYTQGFLVKTSDPRHQNYQDNSSDSDVQRFSAEFESYDRAADATTFMVKNKLSEGDLVEVVTPAGNRDLRLVNLTDGEGNAIATAPGGGWRIRLPGEFHPQTLIARYLPREAGE